ncbi:hypothetical protein NDU88_006179 [Pleurodeles waltl]|uniref:Uncharacterized protein n=1 Tax=Pleurodeles waltl TaxID=8319 RepID=A0AAV7QIB3_PLEWA|nr:hypothetical protein NDU88_006179 [Pleurodeles waltl]
MHRGGHLKSLSAQRRDAAGPQANAWNGHGDHLQPSALQELLSHLYLPTRTASQAALPDLGRKSVLSPAAASYACDPSPVRFCRWGLEEGFLTASTLCVSPPTPINLGLASGALDQHEQSKAKSQ